MDKLKTTKDYIGYEYKEIHVKSSQISIYLDSYYNFGWEIDMNTSKIVETGTSIIKLKRNRKIVNKVELTRLERNFDDCIKQIESLESSKTQRARLLAIFVGIIGTVFITGSTFAVVNEPPIIWLCILFAVPGFMGWILPYFVFKYERNKRREIVTPLIEEKYDEIYDICEKGNKLLKFND